MVACAPALDWRSVRPTDSGATLLFPCRPQSQTRSLTLAGREVRMDLLACHASGATFALAHADVADASRVGPALAALRAAAAANLDGPARPQPAPVVPGMTPHPEAGRLQVDGHRPKGAPAHLDAAFFAKGSRVFQASVVAEAPLDPAAVQAFFESIDLR